MPVKVDTQVGRCSPLPFDCDLLYQFEQELVSDDCLSNLDEYLGNLMPTPPQSPSIKFDFNDFTMGNFFEENLTDLEQNLKLINHDCMWSGNGCNEGRCPSVYKSSITNSWNRPETPFNLSTSPITTFNDLTTMYDIGGGFNDSLHNGFMIEDVPEQTSAEGNMYAMANDHSYESSSPVSIKQESEDENTHESSLLNKNPVKILNAGKITKIKCKKVSHKKPLLENSSSILNAVPRASPIKTETSVLKPTIISVANFKNLPDQTKYKVAIKKKKISIADAKKNGGRQLIQIKNMPAFSNNNITAMPLVSPSCSDSEESSISFGSSGDDSRKTSPPFRRREHNDSERKRRDHLRNSFNNLKDQIPKLKSAEKRPPRIMILHEATSYVTQLIDTNYSLEKTLEAELEKKKRLMSILKSMKDSSC